MKVLNKSFWQATLKRALHTVVQTAIGAIGTAQFVEEVSWLGVLSASALAGLVSVLKSILVGVPEAAETEKGDEK